MPVSNHSVGVFFKPVAEISALIDAGEEAAEPSSKSNSVIKAVLFDGRDEDGPFPLHFLNSTLVALAVTSRSETRS